MAEIAGTAAMVQLVELEAQAVKVLTVLNQGTQVSNVMHQAEMHLAVTPLVVRASTVVQRMHAMQMALQVGLQQLIKTVTNKTMVARVLTAQVAM